MDVFDLVAKISLDTSEYESGLSSAKTSASKFASGLKTAAVAGATAVAAVGTAAIAAGKSIASNVLEISEYGDEVDKMSQKVGMSAEAYQQWDYVMQISGTEMSNMTTGLKTLTNKLDEAKNGSEDAQAMFKKLGLSMDDLAGMSREDVFAAVITGFQGMAESTERAALANDLFGRSGQELAPLFNTSVEETERLKSEVLELGGVMSGDAVKAAADLQDHLTSMKTAFSGLKRGMMGDFMPAVTTIIDGLTGLATGSDDASEKIKQGVSEMIGQIDQLLPQIIDLVTTLATTIAENAPEILSTIAQGLLDALPTLTESAPEIINGLVSALLGLLPQFADAALQIIVELANGLGDSLPTLIPQIVDIVLQIVQTLIDHSSELNEAALQIIIGLTEGILAAIPELLDRLPELITGIVDFIIGSIPQIIDAGIDLLTALVDALPDIIDKIVEVLPQIITGIVDALLSNIDQIIQAGVDLLIALVQDLPTIIETIVEALPQIIQGIVDGLIANIDQIILAGVQLLVALIENLPEIIEEIVKALPDIIIAIVDALLEGVEALIDVGWELIKGLWEGIKAAAEWLWEKVKGIFTGLWNGIKDFLGISSPSKLFRDTIGKQITLGIAEGLVSRDVIRALDQAAAELTGEVVEDLETMTKAWNDVFNNFYEGIEHQNFFAELNNDTETLVANYKKIQQTLHEQKVQYLAMGVDANDSAIRQMEEDWWKYQKEIEAVYKSIEKAAEETFNNMTKVLEHNLFLAEKRGATYAERLDILYELMEKTHARANELREQGYSDESDEIMSLQKAWWGYHDDVEKIHEDIASEFEEVAKAAQDAYDKAFSEIEAKQTNMQNKLAGYGSLFTQNSSYTGPGSVVWLNDLNAQTAQLEKYGEIIQKLRERGVGETLMEEILGLNVDQGNAFGSKLLSLSDEAFDEYMQAYEKKQEVAASIAAQYYKPEFDVLNGTEMSLAEQKSLEYDEEQTNLLRRVVDALENGEGKIEITLDGNVLAEGIFDELVDVSKMRGMSIVDKGIV